MNPIRTFGRKPDKEYLDIFKRYPNYHDEAFENLSKTIMMTKGNSFPKIMWEFFFNRPRNTVPPGRIPGIRTDLGKLGSMGHKPVIIWFGHSSYLIHADGLHILVDPVFSGHASPFSFITKSFEGSDLYKVADLPPIDLLILTHDHYDHLDFETVVELKSKTKMVYTSLGVGSHLQYWGWDKERIVELGWGESGRPVPGIRITAAPARHFSGRGFIRNKTLWSSFILETSDHKIYVGGDSGYDSHFRMLGDSFGPFDIAILEAGQYNEAWPQIHMMPEQTVQAAIDLRARMLLPVHWGKFSLSLHAWDDPARRISAYAPSVAMPFTSPMIGEPIILGTSYPDKKWWEMVSD